MMRRPLRSFEEKVAATLRNPARGTPAGARVPSALPVPRQRIPRLIGGGAPDAPPAGPEWAYAQEYLDYPNSGANLDDLDLSAWFDGYDVGSTMALVVYGSEAAPALPAGWTSHGTGSIGTLDYAVGTLVTTGSDDWVVDLPGIPSDWDTGSYDDLAKFKVGAFGAVFGGANDGTLSAAVGTSTGLTASLPAGSGVAPWNVVLGTPNSSSYQPGGPSWTIRYSLDWSAGDPTTIGVTESPYYMGAIGAADAYTLADLTGTVGMLDAHYLATLDDPISGDWVTISFGWTA